MEQQEQVEVVVEKQHADPVVAAELAELQAAIDAEERGTPEVAADAQATESVAAQPTASPEVQDLPESQAHAGAPTAALIAERRKRQELAAQNLVLQGQVQAFMAMSKPAESASTAEPEPEVPTLAAIRQQKTDLAKMAGEGDISLEEWEAQRQALDDQEWTLRTAQLQPVAQAQTSDLHLEQATVALETQYPVLAVLTAADLAPLADIARRQAERDGTPIQDGSIGTLDLRTRIAKLANQMYGGKPAVSQPPAALSAEAQARAAKIAFAANMPPDVSKIGAPASDTLSTEADVLARMEGKTEAQQLELMKSLPPSTRMALGLG